MRLIVKAISTIRSRSKQLSAQKTRKPNENSRKTTENISIRWIKNGFIEKARWIRWDHWKQLTRLQNVEKQLTTAESAEFLFVFEKAIWIIGNHWK